MGPRLQRAQKNARGHLGPGLPTCCANLVHSSTLAVPRKPVKGNHQRRCAPTYGGLSRRWVGRLRIPRIRCALLNLLILPN